MGIGLTFDEYVDVKLKPPAGADRTFHQAAEMERNEMFPMSTAAAASHLRSRGYDCKPVMLDLLVKNGVVTLAQPDVWTQADVDAAAAHFEECEIFVPDARLPLRRFSPSAPRCRSASLAEVRPERARQ